MARLSQKEKENALNEVRILASLESEFIVSYKEAFYEESCSSLCLVMELLEGGSLQDLIDSAKVSRRHLSEDAAWLSIAHISAGLKVLHDRHILHRDIKSANIFVNHDHTRFKIGDMNVSKLNKQGFLLTQTGTPYYASPEIWQDKPYDYKSDIWSLGCVFYEMLAHNPPFMANDMKALYEKINRAIFRRIPIIYSDALQDLIKSCL